jgi:hypothetical protein
MKKAYAALITNIITILVLALIPFSGLAQSSPGLNITGVVIRPYDNKFVKNCGVDISKDGKWYGGTRTDNLGRFNIQGLKDGIYTFKAIPERYSGDTTYSIYAVSEKFTVRIQNGKYTGPPVALKLRFPQVSGEVLDEKSCYPKDWSCLVRVICDKTGWCLDDVVHGNGVFRVAGLDDGLYSIRAVYLADDGKYQRESNIAKFEIRNGKYDGSDIQLTLFEKGNK